MIIDHYNTDRISSRLINVLRSQVSFRNPRELFAFILEGYSGATPRAEAGSPDTCIRVFDPSTSKWTDHEVQLPHKLAYIGAVLIGPCVYMCGGYVIKNNGGLCEVSNQLVFGWQPFWRYLVCNWWKLSDGMP